jgi:ABC-type uncharacterized transport system ATPase subunit
MVDVEVGSSGTLSTWLASGRHDGFTFDGRLADQGYAVMLVSHNLSDVFQVSDRVAIMRLGQTVAQ